MNRLLVGLGILLLVIGLLWPWLTKLGLFRLPGDFRVERDNFQFYFPLTTMIVISVVVSLLLWLFRK